MDAKDTVADARVKLDKRAGGGKCSLEMNAWNQGGHRGTLEPGVQCNAMGSVSLYVLPGKFGESEAPAGAVGGSQGPASQQVGRAWESWTRDPSRGLAQECWLSLPYSHWKDCHWPS